MKSGTRLLIVLIAMTFLPLAAWAQSDGTMWFRMNLVTVKPEYIDEFMELQKEITAATKERGVAFRAAWTMASFGTNYRFAFFTPMESFAELDEPSTLDPAIGAKFLKYVSARESHAGIFYPELSKMVEGEPKLAIVTISSVAPGKHREYMEYYKTHVVPYMSRPETGLQGFATWRTIFGPGADTWTTLAFIDKYAYIDDGPMAARTVDEAGRAEMAKKQAGMVTNVQRFLSRYVPELSYSSEAPSTDSNGRE